MSVRILPRASLDLLDIWDYIATDSIRQADRIVDEFDRVFKLIAKNPLMGRARDELEEGLRSFPLAQYVIFYSPSQNGIEVLRILHSARDVDDAFDQ